MRGQRSISLPDIQREQIKLALTARLRDLESFRAEISMRYGANAPAVRELTAAILETGDALHTIRGK